MRRLTPLHSLGIPGVKLETVGDQIFAAVRRLGDALVAVLPGIRTVSYTHLTLPTIYSV